MREDLLAIREEDVIALTNRGTLKRVQRELEKGGVEVEFVEADGELRAQWSDGILCVFGPGESLTSARCSCGSRAEVCRHLLRTLFAYQRERRSEPVELREWDPGAWPDREEFFPTRDERRARRIWNRGLVMELSRGSRPEARFHRLGHLVRFVVPDEPAAGVCDCTEESPCIHILLASQGFQKLPTGVDRGIVAVGRGEEPPDGELLERASRALGTLVEEGFSGAGSSTWSRLEGVAGELDEAGLRWMAQIVEELLVLREAYRVRSARFSAGDVLDLIGEFSLRVEVGRGDLPEGLSRYFVVGHKERGESTFGPATVLGLGSEVRMQGDAAELVALAQDTQTGRVVGISRIFEPDSSDDLPGFDELGGRRRGAIPAIRELGESRVVIEKARVTSSLRLRTGRRPVGMYGESDRWEEVRPPVRVEDLGELERRLASLPPSSLRPRRIDSGFFVCPVGEIETPRFCARTQAVRATLSDSAGSVELFHPFLHRNAGGTEALLEALRGARVLFVAGRVRPGRAGWCIEPSGVLVEEDGERRVIQPWLDSAPESAPASTLAAPSTARSEADGEQERLQRLLSEVREVLLDVTLLGREEGLRRRDSEMETAARRCGITGLQAHCGALQGLRRAMRQEASRSEFYNAFFRIARLARWCLDLSTSPEAVESDHARTRRV